MQSDHTCSRRRRGGGALAVLACSIATALLLTAWVGGASAQDLLPLAPSCPAIGGGPGTPGNFAIDGNLTVETGQLDWFSFINQSTCQVISGNTVFARDSTWAGSATDIVYGTTGNKDEDCIGPGLAAPAPWTYKVNVGYPQKDDITEVYLHSDINLANGHRILYVGVGLRETSGDKTLGLIYARAGFNVVASDPTDGFIYGLGPNCGHTNEDPFLAVDFTNGGANATLYVRKWFNDHYICVDPDTIPKPPTDTIFYARVNYDGPVDGPGCGVIQPFSAYVVGPQYQAHQFTEMAFDLTALGFSDSTLCSSNGAIVVQTRSSSSLTATLKDLIIIPFSPVKAPNCRIDGPDSVCQNGTATLCDTVAQASPVTHSWTIDSSSPPGIATIPGSTTDACVTLSFSGHGTVTVRDHVDNGQGCPAECTKTITVDELPTAVIVKPVARQCVAASGPNSFNLTTSSCSGGTVSWTSLQGSITFGTPSACNTTASVTGAGVYIAKITVTPPAGSNCPAASDTVSFVVDGRAAAVAAKPAAQCVAVSGPNTFTLDGSGSSGGTCHWTQISGPAVTFGNANNCNTTGSFTGAGTAVVLLTVTPPGGSACPPDTEAVVLQVDQRAVATVAKPAAQCVAVSGPNTFTIDGSGSTGGACHWTQISGPAVTFGNANNCNTTASFTGPGTAVVLLTVTPSAPSQCPPDTESVVLRIDTKAVAQVTKPAAQCVALAGPNTFNLNSTCSGGTPHWTQISGPAVTFGDPNACTTTASFTGPGTAVVLLTVSPSGGGECPPDTESVVLQIDSRSVASALKPAAQCVAVSGPNTFTLDGSGSTGGTCHWTQISGPAVTFGNANNCNTTGSFTGPGTAVVLLTVTPSAPSACPPDTEAVVLQVDQRAAVAIARPVTAQCQTATNTFNLTTTTCSGGTVQWTGSGITFGSPNSCNTTATVSGVGVYLATITVTPAVGNQCPPVSDTISFVVNPVPSCSIDPFASLPACGSAGNTQTAHVTGGTPPYTYLWTQLCDPSTGWAITGGQGTATITLTAGNGVACDFRLFVTDAAGCTTSCTVRDSCSSSTEFCSLTQGAYGNATGKFNGETRLAFLQRVITPANPLVIGVPTTLNASSCGSITFSDGNEACVIKLMPAGGKAATFPTGMGDINVIAPNCAIPSSLYNPPDTRFGNVLIGQTIALSLNLRLDSNLGGLALCPNMVTQKALPGPDGLMGTPDDIPDPSDPGTQVQIPQSIFDAMDALGLPHTVSSLLILLNRGLSCLSTAPATINDLNSAATAINEGFDECRFLVRCESKPSTQAQYGGGSRGGSQTQVSLPLQFGLDANAPNPFSNMTRIRFAVPQRSHVRIAVYDVMGHEVATLVNGEQGAGYHSVEWHAVDRSGNAMRSGVYFYRMEANSFESRLSFTRTLKMLIVR